MEQTEDILWPEPDLLDADSWESAAKEICVTFTVHVYTCAMCRNLLAV